MVVLRCKVILAGDCEVGKSSLVQMFQSNGKSFPKNYVMVPFFPSCKTGCVLINIPVFCYLFILNVLSRSFLQNWQTSGVDLAVKVVNIPDTDTAVELYLYDTSGADLYSQMRPPLVRWSTVIRPGPVIRSASFDTNETCATLLDSGWVHRSSWWHMT